MDDKGKEILGIGSVKDGSISKRYLETELDDTHSLTVDLKMEDVSKECSDEERSCNSDSDHGENTEIRILHCDPCDKDVGIGVLDSDKISPKQMSKFRIYKNLYVFSFAYLLLFCAFNSFTNLQSTLYSAGSLGTLGLSILYIVYSAATLFATVYTTSRFTCKRITLISMVTYALYVCTGFYPTLATVVSASVLIGLGAANLWVVQHAYMTELAKMYAALTNRSLEDITNIFFGIFFGIFQTTQIWGNLVSSLVLKTVRSSNFTPSLEVCGVDYCPGSLNMTSIQAPSQHQTFVFISICVGMSVLAIVTCLFMEDIKTPSTSSTTLSDLLKSVFHHIIHSRDQKLLVIPTIYRGLAPGFILGDFTVSQSLNARLATRKVLSFWITGAARTILVQAFVSCPLGVNFVGFVMIAYGVTSAVSSVVFGKLVKYTGHIPLFILALMSHGAHALTMLLWKPDPDKSEIIFIIVAIWSIGHAALMLLTTSKYSTLFKGSTATPAYSTCRLMDSIGWAISLVMSIWMCLRAKIIVMLVTMTLSFVTLVMLVKRKRTK